MNYQIGPWQFIENRCVLVAGNIERELDPLLVKLLLYFVAKSQQIVPRQELVEQVWKQSFVDDNAINRAISELRKQLAHPVHKAPLIKTHYRKGYSLTVVAEPLKKSEPTRLLDTPVNSNSIESNHQEEGIPDPQVELIQSKNNIVAKRLIIAVILVLIITGISWAVLRGVVENDNEKNKEVAATLIPSTWNIGAEANPELSSDRQFLAYTNIEPAQGAIRAFVKRFSDQREVELVYPGFQVSILSWQLNQHRVLLQAIDIPNQRCEIVLADLTDFPIIGELKSIKQCELRYAGFAQLDEAGEYLYFADYKAQRSGAGLFRLHLKQNKEATLIPTSDIMFGVNMPRLSPNGKQIAYVLNQQGQPFSVYVYNLASSETKRVFQAKEKRISFAFDWLPNDSAIQIGEENQLTTVYLNGTDIVNTETITITPEISPFYLASYAADSLFFSPGQTQQLSLLKVSNLFSDEPQQQAIFSSQSDNYNAIEFTNAQGTGKIFVSNRSGSAQLWMHLDGREQQLSELEYEQGDKSQIALLRLASNGKFVLLNYNKKLAFFDIASKRMHSLPELADFNITTYTWADGSESLYFIDQQDQNYHLWQFSLLTRDLTKREDIQPHALLSAPDGAGFAVTDDELIRLRDNKRWAIPKELQSALFHTVNHDYLYFNDAISQVSRLNLHTNEVEKTLVDFHPIVFSVNAENELLFSKRQYKSTQIMQVTWQ